MDGLAPELKLLLLSAAANTSLPSLIALARTSSSFFILFLRNFDRLLPLSLPELSALLLLVETPKPESNLPDRREFLKTHDPDDWLPTRSNMLSKLLSPSGPLTLPSTASMIAEAMNFRDWFLSEKPKTPNVTDGQAVCIALLDILHNEYFLSSFGEDSKSSHMTGTPEQRQELLEEWSRIHARLVGEGYTMHPLEDYAEDDGWIKFVLDEMSNDVDRWKKRVAEGLGLGWWDQGHFWEEPEDEATGNDAKVDGEKKKREVKEKGEVRDVLFQARGWPYAQRPLVLDGGVWRRALEQWNSEKVHAQRVPLF